MTGYKVIVGAVRAEARKWNGASDATASVQSEVAGAELGVSAFFIGFPGRVPPLDAPLLHMTYTNFQKSINDLLTAAVTEFDELAGALRECADEYQDHEKICTLNLKKIYSK